MNKLQIGAIHSVEYWKIDSDCNKSHVMKEKVNNHLRKRK